MAQHEINIEAGIIPVLDQRSADEVMKRLQKMLSRIGSGQHTAVAQEFQNLFGQVVASRVVSGKATTATSARIAAEQSLGIKGGSVVRALTREAADMASVALKEGRVSKYRAISAGNIARMSPQNAAIATAYNDAVFKFLEAKDKPTPSEKDALIKQLNEISTAVKSIGKTQPKALKAIEKDAKNMSKEVSSWKTSGRASVAGLGAFSDSLKQLFEWVFRAFSAQKIFTTIEKGIERGDKSWIESAMYGTSRDVALDRMLANVLQMDESVFADVQRKAITYRERLKWNQVSPAENIMWARLGLLPYISSGEAGKSPRAFMETFFKSIREKSPQEALSALQTGGLNAQLIYAANTLPTISQKKQNEIYQDYLQRVSMEQYASMETLPTRSWWGRRGADVTAGLSMAVANFATSGLSAKNFRYLSDVLKGKTYEMYKPVNQAIVEGRNPTLTEKMISTPVVGPLLEEPARKTETVQYVTNYVTQNITGADSDDIAEKTVENLNMLNLNSTIKTKATAR